MKTLEINIGILIFLLLLPLHLFSKKDNVVGDVQQWTTSHKIRDSVPVQYYQLISPEINVMQKLMIDSIQLDFDCNKIEHVFLTATNLDSGCIQFRIKTMRNHPLVEGLYPSNISELACFKVNGTLFFMDNENTRTFTFFSNLIYQRTYESVDKLSGFKYECLSQDVSGENFNILFYFTFRLCDGFDPQLVKYTRLVDSGDTGYFDVKVSKFRMFFLKLFNKNYRWK